MPLPTITREWKAIGTDIWVEIVLPGDYQSAKALAAIDAVEKRYRDLTQVFSRFDPESELSRCNTNLGTPQSVSPELITTAERSLRWHQWSRGYFDPRILPHLRAAGYREDFFTSLFSLLKGESIPKKPEGRLADQLSIDGQRITLSVPMDFSGIAKGFITDAAATLIKQFGFGDFLIDSGGDMYASGHDELGTPWLIDLENASRRIAFRLSDQSIATSGITRRQWHIEGAHFHHLINPFEPETFHFDLLSVTAQGPTTEAADIRAKTLFLMGETAGLAFANEKNIPAVFLRKDASATLSESAKQIIVE